MNCDHTSIVKHGDDEALIQGFACRTWRCEICGPRRRASLVASAKAGHPQRFITLTMPAKWASNPAVAVKMLSKAFKGLIEAERDRHPQADIAYLVVVERTKAGTPHLHVLYRGPFIPHRRIKAWMLAHGCGSVVDVRLARSARGAARYIAKYVGKEPARIGTCKRHWQSKHWDDAGRAWRAEARDIAAARRARDPWSHVRASFNDVSAAQMAASYAHMGYFVMQDAPSRYWAWDSIQLDRSRREDGYVVPLASCEVRWRGDG